MGNPPRKPKGAPGCVVALGGSAGALHSFERFFRAVPENLDASYVLIQHMDPTQKSFLAELVSHWTKLPVEVPKHGSQLRSRCIYVREAGTTLDLKDGVFSIEPEQIAERERYPIDRFMKSLAEDYTRNAIGIVFSGTGTDGTKGLRAIQGAGGRTLVQEPTDAKFDGMPESAIAAGVVDRIKNAEELAKELSVFMECANVAVSEDNHGQEIAEICEILRRKMGHDFSSYKKSTLARRVERRLQANLLPNLSAYMEFLEREASEPRALLRDLLISVTQFFRDPDAFDALQKQVIPKLFEDVNPGECVRVWVPACATGEEAYTLAILLLEHRRKHHPQVALQIFATDIDREALETARQGIYPASIEEHVPPAYLVQFFKKHEKGYRTNQELREICLFSEHSLLKHPPFSKIDLISCRNLFIYWEPDLQKRILPIFHYALNPAGYLFLGPAESVATDNDLFKVVDKKCRIFQRMGGISRQHLNFPILNVAARAQFGTESPVRVHSTGERDVGRLITSALLDNYAPPAFVVGEHGEIAYYSGHTGKYIEVPTGVPSNNVFDVIARPLRPELHALLHRSIKTKAEVVHPGVVFEKDGTVRRLSVSVRPLNEVSDDRGLYLVVIQEVANPKSREEALKDGVTLPQSEPLVEQLEAELRETREHLQSTIEEVKSSNEELLSMNEELHSANEELQTSKEELQSTNEELETVNSELAKKLEELDASNSDLQNFFHGTQVPILFLDRAFRIQKFTPAATKIFRLIPSDLGRGILDITSLVEGADLITDCARVLESLQPLDREMRTKDGIAIYLMRVSPYRTLSNVIAGVIVAFSDITELKRAQQTKNTLAAIVESSSDAIVSRDLDGNVTSWNMGAERIFGYSRKEAVGRPITLIIIPEDKREEFRHLEKTVLGGGSVSNIDTERVRKDGKRISVTVTMSLIRDDSGKVLGLSVIFRDNSEKKRTEETIKRSHEQLVDVLESMGDAFFAIDSDWKMIRVNSNYEKISRVGRADSIGKNFWEIFPEAKKLKYWTEYQRVMKDRVPSSFEEYYEPLKIWTQVDTYPTKEGGIVVFFRDITQQKQTLQRVEEANAQFKSLANSIANLAWIAHADGFIHWYNDRWYQYTGTQPKDMEGWGWQSVHDPKELPRVLESWKSSIATGEPFEMTFPLKGADGKFKWFLTRGTPVLNSDGKVAHWFGTNTDIDAEIRSREALEESERRLKFALEAAEMGTFDWSMSTGKLLWSERTASLHGISLEEFEGSFEHARKLTHPEDHEQMVRNIAESARKKEAFSGEYRVIWPKDNSVHWLFTFGQMHLDEQGNPSRSVGLVIDITERKRAELEVGKHAAIVKSSNDAIISKDLHSIITSWNDAAARMFGYSAEEMVGQSIKVLIPKDRLHEEDEILAAISRGKPITHFETIRLKKDGTPIQVSVSISPVKDNRGNIIGAAKIARDITNQKRVEAALTSAVSARDQFLSIASHELKTPLTSLKLDTQMRKRRLQAEDMEAFTVDRLRLMLEKDERQIQRLTRLIDDMLDIARISTGKLTVKPESVDFGELVKDVAERFQDQIAEARSSLDVKVSGRIIGHWDRYRIEQVVTNLISNALKYGPGKPISIRVELEGDDAKLTVRDQGVGIAQKDQQRVFNQFERAVSDEGVSGLGLGLFIVKEILESHGGTIRVESEQGKGSSFIVTLPLGDI